MCGEPAEPSARDGACLRICTLWNSVKLTVQPMLEDEQWNSDVGGTACIPTLKVPLSSALGGYINNGS